MNTGFIKHCLTNNHVFDVNNVITQNIKSKKKEVVIYELKILLNGTKILLIN